jgi:hypothetical protein
MEREREKRIKKSPATREDRVAGPYGRTMRFNG